MIQKFIDRWLANKAIAEEWLRRQHPDKYKDLVGLVVKCISDKNEYYDPDPDRIHQIDDGDDQGTLVFVIGAKDYQPYDYWYVRIGYGSCSACDTLAGIRERADGPPNEEQVKDYMTLCLHIVERMKQMDGDYQ